MALFKVCGKVPKVRDRLSSLVINGKKASRYVLAAWLGWCPVHKWWVSSHLTLVGVTGLKDVILGRSFGKVLGTLRQSSGLRDLHMVSVLSWKKDAKPSTTEAYEPGGIWFPPGSLVGESKSPNNFHWSPWVYSIAAFRYRHFALFN